MSARLGHASLDVLAVLALTEARVEHLADSTKRPDETVRRCLHRLRALALVAREGKRSATWRITEQGRARLKLELDKGRIPGVSEPRIRPEPARRIGHVQLDLLDTLSHGSATDVELADDTGTPLRVVVQACKRMRAAGLVLLEDRTWTITRRGTKRLREEVARGRVPGVPTSRPRRLHDGDEHMDRVRALMRRQGES